MVGFREMSEAEFIAYKAFLIEDYARDIAQHVGMSDDEARNSAATRINDLLQHGRTTPGELLYIVVKEETQESIGYLWCRIDQARRRAFIYDIEIHEAYRGKGYGKSTLDLLEAKLKALGMTTLGLHVFVQNATAIRLYTQQGYRTTGLDMQKDL